MDCLAIEASFTLERSWNQHAVFLVCLRNCERADVPDLKDTQVLLAHGDIKQTREGHGCNIRGGKDHRRGNGCGFQDTMRGQKDFVRSENERAGSNKNARVGTGLEECKSGKNEANKKVK